jgi:hypothetical protein
MQEKTQIGNIGNYYGGLYIKESNDKYYWSIEDHDGFRWEQISHSLYTALLLHDRLQTEIWQQEVMENY